MSEPITPETLPLVCTRVNELIRKHGPKNEDIARELGWSLTELEHFREEYEAILNFDATLWAETPQMECPITDADINTQAPIVPQPPTDKELSDAVAHADSQISKGLEALGLRGKEVQVAEALHNFNRQFFMESMDMVTAGAMKTSLIVQADQGLIRDRLEFVRKVLTDMGANLGGGRDEWLKEEKMLAFQLTEAGGLVNDISESFYRGAAALAVIRMRSRDQLNNPNGQAKQSTPGFRAKREAVDV